MARAVLLLAFLGVLLALLGIELNKKRAKATESPFDGSFELLAPDLWRQGYRWESMGSLCSVDVYVFLIRTGGDYILIDAGAPDDGAAKALLSGLKEVLMGRQLKLILLTHGHPDHIGALSAVIKMHPDVQVVVHEGEVPYLLGKSSYRVVRIVHDRLIPGLLGSNDSLRLESDLVGCSEG